MGLWRRAQGIRDSGFGIRSQGSRGFGLQDSESGLMVEGLGYQRFIDMAMSASSPARDMKPSCSIVQGVRVKRFGLKILGFRFWVS